MIIARKKQHAGVVGEVPVGPVNGANKIFATAYVFKSGTTYLYLNGQRLNRTEYAEGVDRKSLLTELAPRAGDQLEVDYTRD